MIDRLDIQALADGELGKEQEKALREALRQDSKAKAEYESILNFKQYVLNNVVAYRSEDGWKACQKRLNELDRTKRVESFVSRYAWAMCAAFFVIILGSRFMVPSMRGLSGRTADLLPQLGGQASTISPEAQRTYSHIFDIVGAAVDPHRLRIISRSVDTFQDYHIAHYNLSDGHGPLALFVIPASVNFEDSSELPTEPGVYEGLISAPESTTGHANCLIWHHGDMTVVLAGTRSTQALEDVRSQLAP